MDISNYELKKYGDLENDVYIIPKEKLDLKV